MKIKRLFFNIFLSVLFNSFAYALPNEFVYLDQIDPTIIQDLRYATAYNFVGRQIDGYESGRCILTKLAAQHLHEVQAFLLNKGYSLKVYDCYRPTRAVDDFVSWSKDQSDQGMKQLYYPRINKKDVFKLGYVALHSGHSRGSTIDLTLVSMNKQKKSYPPQSCLKPSIAMRNGYELNMGSSYDCLDPISHVDSQEISQSEKRNRLWLQSIMIRHGFNPYDKEWWHFTLASEPYMDQYFDFPVA